jgi:thiamine biosynthesis lipoprotein
MRDVKFIMGMPTTIDIPECEDEVVIDYALQRLRGIDRRFSPYKINSELRKFQRGKIEEKDLSPEFKRVIAACKEAEAETDGYFSAHYSDKFDPSGYVKGWAINEAGKLIERSGFSTYCIGAGGDILARSDSEQVWNIGILDPEAKHNLIGKISGANFAVATSGIYERGKHIINPKTGSEAEYFLSVTAVGPDIEKADILATAVFAAEEAGLALAEKKEGYEVLVVDRYGRQYQTSGMRAVLESGIS